MYCSTILKKKKKILFHRFFSLSSFSALFSIQTKHHLFSLFLLCWVRCLGRWSWFVVGLWVRWRRGSVVVVVFGVVVGCGLWIGVVGSWSWIGGWRGSLVVDRRAGMKWVVGRGSAAEVGRWSWLGCDWGGFGDDFFLMGLLRWVSNRGWVVVVVCSGRGWVSNRLRWWFFFIGMGLCLCLCLC